MTTTYTFQKAQANINDILNQMDAGTQGSISLIKTNGASVVAKLVPYATYAAADIAGSADMNNVPQIQMASGPMTNPGTDGLYKMTKMLDDADAIPNGAAHATLQVTQGAGGVLYTAVAPGTPGNSVTVAYVVAGLNTALSVGVVGTAITVNLATDGAGAATTTAAGVAAAVTGSAPAAALVTAAANGTTTTLAAAFGTASLAGGGNPPAGVKKFQAFGIFRKRVHSKNALVAPAVRPRAVLLSATHAAYIGV